MKYAYFSGCKIPYFCPQYGTSTKTVLEVLDIDMVEPEFNCCGYPIRHFDHMAFVLQSARNLAIAGKMGRHILTPCKCCYGSLMHARHFLRENPEEKQEINRVLKKEGLCWDENVEIRHLLSFFLHDIGADRIGAMVKRPCTGLRVAPHYGCHALRPSDVVALDDPFAPTIFEGLIRVTGAESIAYAKRLECCGQPVAEKNWELSLKLTRRKLESAFTAGADFICTACTYCQLQFDALPEKPIPALVYPQLLGLSMGLSEKRLGLDTDPFKHKKLSRFFAA